MPLDEFPPAGPVPPGGGDPTMEVYQELRRIARRQFRREAQGHTLQPTAVVHEAFLRLAAAPASRWRDRGHFLATAARVIRHILINHARDRARLKRGGGFHQTTWVESRLEEAPEGAADRVDLLALHDALDSLADLDPRKASIVELRFFGGMTFEEVAAELDLSESTVKREWRSARAWLGRTLSGAGHGAG